MKRIAILGCENSHANAFLKCIRDLPEFSDIEVFGVYSRETEAAELLREKFGVPVLSDYSEAVGKIDGLIITARHGDDHLTFAEPYIGTGIPMFIDKPITVTEEDALSLARSLKECRVKVCGGSSLKQDATVRKLKKAALEATGGKTVGGYVRAPYYSDSVYGGFYFYAQHLVEMVCEIFGRFPLSVVAKKTSDNIHVIFHYENYDCIGLFCEKRQVYYASRMSETHEEGYTLSASEDWYRAEFREFCSILSGEREGISYESLISPVYIMNAILRSVESGREEFIHKICL